jgi:hypothetical protein
MGVLGLRKVRGVVALAACATLLASVTGSAQPPVPPVKKGEPAQPITPITGKKPEPGPVSSPAAKEGTEKAAAQPTKQPEEPLHLKVFALTNADPEEVRQVLNQVCQNMHGVRSGVAGPAVTPGFPGAAPPVANHAPRIAVDAKSKTVFVRGTDKQLKVAADVVSLLDAQPGQAPPEVKELKVLHLKQAKADEVMQVLSSLGLNTSVATLKKANAVIVFPGSEAAADEVRQVVERLDSIAADGTGASKAKAGPTPPVKGAPKTPPGN